VHSETKIAAMMAAALAITPVLASEDEPASD
jgi:hypothetical protein